MNKRRHITYKQSRQHKLMFGVLSGGDIGFSEKSKKEKLRSLSTVGTASSSFQMGCIASEEQPLSSTYIPSRPNMFDEDISFPRKLRSATKKRGREFMLNDPEEVTVNHSVNMDGEESLEKDSVKESNKQRVNYDWSRIEGLSGPITREEEEVAETLYAMSRMVSDNGFNHSSKELHEESLPDNSSGLIDLEDNASADLEDSILASATTQGASTHCHESSAGEASKMSCLNEAVGQEQPNEPMSPNFVLPSYSTCLTLKTVPEVVNRENCKIAFLNSGLHLEIGEPPISQTGRKPDVESEAKSDNSSKQQQQHMIKERKGTGLTLWPELSTVAPAGQANPQSSATNLDLTETSASSSSGKNFIPKRSWKRCATHVHISHMIKDLKLSKKQVIEETELNESHQMGAYEGSKSGVHLGVHGLNVMKNGATSSTVKNPRKGKNIIRQQQCHYRNISQAAPTSVAYGLRKQNFNFLPLSAGCNGLKVENNYNKPMSKFQVPYFQSLPQQHSVMPIPAAQSQYATTTYLNQLSVAGSPVQLQQPLYFGNPLYGTNYSSTVSYKQEHQCFRGVQHAEQGRSTVNLNNMRTQYPNWQSGRHDSSALGPCTETIVPCCPASQEIFGSNLTSISEKQKQVLALFPDERTGPSSSSCMLRN